MQLRNPAFSHILLREFRRVAAAEGVSINVSIQQGDPAETILLHANSRRHDAIVIGTHGRTGLERFRMGSVAFNHILCPVNITPPSKTALEHAMGLLKGSGERLTVLHVGTPKRERHAHIRLQQLVAVPADLRGKIHARLTDGPVATSILSVAAELQPDLIVLGMTSRGGTRKWFNSVTDRIVRASSCPVLTIPGEGRLQLAA